MEGSWPWTSRSRLPKCCCSCGIRVGVRTRDGGSVWTLPRSGSKKLTRCQRCGPCLVSGRISCVAWPPILCEGAPQSSRRSPFRRLPARRIVPPRRDSPERRSASRRSSLTSSVEDRRIQILRPGPARLSRGGWRLSVARRFSFRPLSLSESPIVYPLRDDVLKTDLRLEEDLLIRHRGRHVKGWAQPEDGSAPSATRRALLCGACLPTLPSWTSAPSWPGRPCPRGSSGASPGGGPRARIRRSLGGRSWGGRPGWTSLWLGTSGRRPCRWLGRPTAAWGDRLHS